MEECVSSGKREWVVDCIEERGRRRVRGRAARIN